MALRSCAWNAELFVPETLVWASWHYASQIYRHLLNTDSLTFNGWNVFVDAYPAEINPQQQFHVYPSKTDSYEPTQLPSIVNRLAKLDVGLVSFLCIRDFCLTFDDFKELINIPTLGALVLEQSRRHGLSEFHSRRFHDWGRAVQERNALQKLSLLVMCDFGIGRKAILEGVASFPALTLVGLQNSKTWSMSDAPQHTYGDWELLTESGLEKRGLKLQEFNTQQIWGSSYHTNYSKARKLYHLTKTFAHPSRDKSEEDRSVCITYGGWADRIITYEATSWFIRYSQREAPEDLEMPGVVVVPQDRAESANKRRKVRSRKNMDIGALLGAFR
ncbi:hypothetical protein CC86DRAFT_393468 [Ophiobolus disseminans]|uniref:Uncharacterized protein n=1 Tax=Ophiobolus disseminans TaxID=1469910 RepID=A0A6A7A2A9_9PLEO|nr:hypothetical protein CC86DRAFT_393468 [Ophiobolus disseminans]